MCKYYVGVSSCCGVPHRVGLIVIAILSIVTGALLNGAIKKAGVKVSKVPRFANLQLGEESSDDYLDSFSDFVTMQTETVTTTLSVTTSTKNKTRRTKPCSKATRRRRKRTRTPPPTTTPGYVTMEIVDEYGKTEMVGFRAERDKGIESRADTDSDTDTDAEANSKAHLQHKSNATNITSWMNVTKPPSVIGPANEMARNGLNMLSVMFLGLGLFLLVATFANSPELVLIYVVMCLALCVMCFVVMVAVALGCTNQPDFCVLNKLDVPTTVMLVLFWFVYIFLWAFFAAVANGFVKGKDLNWGIISTM